MLCVAGHAPFAMRTRVSCVVSRVACRLSLSCGVSHVKHASRASRASCLPHAVRVACRICRVPCVACRVPRVASRATCRVSRVALHMRCALECRASCRESRFSRSCGVSHVSHVSRAPRVSRLSRVSQVLCRGVSFGRYLWILGCRTLRAQPLAPPIVLPTSSVALVLARRVCRVCRVSRVARVAGRICPVPCVACRVLRVESRATCRMQPHALEPWLCRPPPTWTAQIRSQSVKQKVNHQLIRTFVNPKP